MAENGLTGLACWLVRQSGLLLGSLPDGFAEDRLQTVMHRFGFKNLLTLTRELPHATASLKQAVIEALTVNDSAFFRDGEVFAEVRDRILPDYVARRADVRRLRIWSVACAAGQEPYSIAILLKDMGLDEAGWQIRLTATDLHTGMIERADAGFYDETEAARGLAPRHLADYFTRRDKGWQAGGTLRRMIAFRPFNLLDDFPGDEAFDIVFCRNVLMYFDPDVRRDVLEKISAVLAPDGVLIAGVAEPTTEFKNLFRKKTNAPPGIYVKTFRAARRK